MQFTHVLGFRPGDKCVEIKCKASLDIPLGEIVAVDPTRRISVIFTSSAASVL